MIERALNVDQEVIEDSDWLVDGLVSRHGLSLLHGDPKSFKSFVALDLALCIGSGRPFHGNDTTRARVCVIAGHGADTMMAWRVPGWCEGNGVPVGELDSFVRFIDRRVHLDNDAHVEGLISSMDDGVDLLVFDTFSNHISEFAWREDHVARALEGCSKLQDRLGAGILIVHFDITEPEVIPFPENLVKRCAVIASVKHSEQKKTVAVEVEAGARRRTITLMPKKIPIRSHSTIVLM